MGREHELDGKVFALTGGASGIGLATASILHARGAMVAVADVDQVALDNAGNALKAKGENRVLLTNVDVSKRQRVDDWIQEVIAHFGRLDGAANCAGLIGKHHGTRKVEELDDDQWNLIMAVNVTGMMYSLRAELKVMKGPGSIVCIGSIQGVMGFAKHAAYSASKHAVHGLVRSAAKEVGERGIRVNAVAPGTIDTPLLHKWYTTEGADTSITPSTPINRLGTADDVATSIVWLLSDESTYVTGTVHSVDGGWAC